MYTRIVVPLDGSELAERALPEAVRLAGLTGASVHLVRVVDLAAMDYYGAFGFAADPGGGAMVMEAEQAVADRYLASVAERVGAGGLAVTTEVRHGMVRRELGALTCEGDLLVMASHGRSGPTRWFLGSVAEDVVRHATVPVLLIRSAPAANKAVEAQPEMAGAGAGR